MKRRQFLTSTGTLLGGLGLHAAPEWKPLPQKRDGAVTRGTARNLIFIHLDGGPSHVDTFDLKINPSTPADLGVETLTSGLLWPSGIFPKLRALTRDFSLVRSLGAFELVHQRGVYHLLTAHRPNAALAKEIPFFDAMISYQLAPFRSNADTLPTLITSGINSINGFLEAKHRGLGLNYSGKIDHLTHELTHPNPRFDLLDKILAEAPAYGDTRFDQLQVMEQAERMVKDPALVPMFSNGSNYNDDTFLKNCRTAVKVLQGNKGCRVFRITQGKWDHHANIYSGYENLQPMARSLDAGLGFLISELKKLPSHDGTQTLFDETLIVACGEFGRTPGPVDVSNGRDHFPDVFSAFFAGGGVKGGRVIGASSLNGSYVTDLGWSHDRQMAFPDLVATIYSAMGIDYLQHFEDTPSRRVFEMVETGMTGAVHEIDQLFD